MSVLGQGPKTPDHGSGWISASDVWMGLRFTSSLVRFLRHPVSREEARATLRSRFEHRSSDFLWLVRKAIYENPSSPYLHLLTRARCEYGDLEKLVLQAGVEGALGALFRNGVFLSVEEFKGRAPLIRGNQTIEISPQALRNPLSRAHFRARTGGSSDASGTPSARATPPPAPSPVFMDLAFLRERSMNHRLAVEFRGGGHWVHAIWSVPGYTDLVMGLELLASAGSLARWFNQVEASSPGLPLRYRSSQLAVRWAARAVGVDIPKPAHVPLTKPGPILRWATAALAAGKIPHLVTFVSPAVLLCQEAIAQSIDLAGMQLTLGGEPLTQARLGPILRSGARAVPRFMAMECGYMGYGCLNADLPDTYHVFHDLNAVIQAGPHGKEFSLASDALLITSMRPSAPYLLLNVSLGDQAVTVERSCGCPLDEFGWSRRITSVRSFRRLTSGGMTILDDDLARVLEDVLPARFGGTPLDYQLIEEEGRDGAPRLLLRVHPRLGHLDSAAVLDVFHEAVLSLSAAARVMGIQWKSAGFVSVQRQAPDSTSSGKVLHFLKARSQENP